MALYRFDMFEFDSATGDLQNGRRRVRLRPQPARALEQLLKRPGELVTRTELQRALWPEGTFVDFDDGLDSCIKQIRAALGGRRSGSAYVETLVRRGFRFTAPVTLMSAPEQPVVARLVEEIVAHLAGAPAGASVRIIVKMAAQGLLETSTEHRPSGWPVEEDQHHGIDHTRDHHVRSS
jgi:DNA-binding winged helix-turn-helix (wHTH) protein